VLDGPRGQETVAVSGRFAANAVMAETRPKGELIRSGAAREHVIAKAADDRIRAIAAGHSVVAGAAGNNVGASENGASHCGSTVRLR
jgi:hypothetical protein